MLLLAGVDHPVRVNATAPVLPLMVRKELRLLRDGLPAGSISGLPVTESKP